MLKGAQTVLCQMKRQSSKLSSNRFRLRSSQLGHRQRRILKGAQSLLCRMKRQRSLSL
jgi:hypothetical protein